MRLPPVTLVRRYDLHRLIPSKYAEGGDSVLIRVASSDRDLTAIFELDNATNDRLLAENNRITGIGIDELVFGVPYFRIVNAAFCHPHPLGSRFNSPERGAWYAGFERDTAIAEIAHHKWIELCEIGRSTEEVTYDDYLADISAELHDIREDGGFADCLNPDSYMASQLLAEELLAAGSLGIVYPSVRHARGTCVACFRPSIVAHVRKEATLTFRWTGEPEPAVALAEHGAAG